MRSEPKRSKGAISTGNAARFSICLNEPERGTTQKPGYSPGPFSNMSEIKNPVGEKDWWAPVWKGLAMDSKAAHLQKMGNALWLFLYLLLNANRATGVLMRRIKTISQDMGLPRSTTCRWLKILREGGYIVTRSSGHSLTIGISKWRPVGEVSGLRFPKSQLRDPGSPKDENSKRPSEVGIMAPVSEESPQAFTPKKNTIKKNILKRRFDDIDFKNFDLSTCKTREELLAYDLAQSLDDFPGLPLYLSYSRKYPEYLLRETLSKVKDIPGSQIKTSRGALFNFLIQKHAQESTDGPRH